MFIIDYGLYGTLIFNFLLMTIFIVPFYFIYIIIYTLLFYLINFIVFNLNKIFINFKDNKIIRRTIYNKNLANPFYRYYLSDRINEFKLYHINKIIKLKTYNNNTYIGVLRYISYPIFVKLKYNLIKYQNIKEINLHEMYSDYNRYQILNLKKKYPIYLPNEINDLIESFLFNEDYFKFNEISPKNSSAFEDQIFSVYYSRPEYADRDEIFESFYF